MSPSIKNLRRGVAAGGVVLLAVVAVFLGVARLKGHHFHLDLPGRLGVDISQTASGFTYSQSQKGHTLFTIHASKLVEYKKDQAELHDVTITLYGPEGSGRADKIYGSEFTYDRKQGIARAMGMVRIDFVSPESKPSQTPVSKPGPAPDPANTIHVTTSGLVFHQASGEASTEQQVNFVLPRATGSAVGAEYNAKDGVLVLDRQVALTTTGAGLGAAGSGSASGSGKAGPDNSGLGATTIHAEHAQVLRETHQAYLNKAEAETGGKRTTSDEATVTFRPDGSAEHMDARGHVHVVTDDGADVHSSSATINLNPQSRPLTANLDGGVTYYSADGDRTMQGASVSASLKFAAVAAKGKPGAEQELQHAQFRNAVSFVLQQRSLHGDPNGSATRELAASTVDVDFAPSADGKAEAQKILAVGEAVSGASGAVGASGATVTLHDVPAKGESKATTLGGDQLLATLVNGRELKLLDGTGHTEIVDRSPDGASSTSTGDALHVTFAPAAGAAVAGAKDKDSTAQVESAVQTGNVVLLQVPAPGKKDADGKPEGPLHGYAQRAEYRAADQVVHLTGSPRLRNDTLQLSADAVDYHRDSGDAAAMGSVKATYTQQQGSQQGGTRQAGAGQAGSLGGDGPVHIVADHAQLTRSTDLSVFYGGAAAARMWQGEDSVSAPVLELAQDAQTLDAHGGRGDRGALVHTVLGAKAAGGASGEQKAPGAGLGSSGPIRLTSATLHYSDQDRRADLRGSVEAEQPTGTVHADQAEVFLTPEEPGKPSQMDHMVATGHIVITQPGRRGTGEKLVYTASDGRYVLTGGPGQPPRITDSQKGTTTGAALIFKSGDDSVEVSDHADSSAASTASSHARTVTDTHVPH